MKDVIEQIRLKRHIKAYFKRLGLSLKPTKNNYLKILHWRMDTYNQLVK